MRKLSFLLLLTGLTLPGFAKSDFDFRGTPIRNKLLALTIECPPNTTISTDQFNCNAVFSYAIAASDDQAGWILAQTAGIPSGGVFPLGETLNQFQVTAIDGNTATCSFTIMVVDSIKPICTAPANVVVSAKNFDPTFLDYGQPTSSDNCCLDTTTTEINYNLFDTVCNKGTIVRNFRAFDCSGNSTLCTQRIVVTYAQDYYVKFPDDVILLTCDGTGNYGVPVSSGNGSASLQVSYEDMFYLLTDVCATLTRVWTIKNTCTFDPGLPFTYLPNPTPSPIGLDSTNMPGPVVSDCAASAPWVPTEVKLHPGDSVTTNFCTFYAPGSSGYKYNQIVRFIDHQDPVFADCPAGPITIIDSTQNDPGLWHTVFNPSAPVQDLGEASVDLNISGTDSCSFASVYIGYLLFLDLDNDGTAETVVNPNNPPATAGVIYYGNATLPNYNGGTPVSFDNRPVPANEKWRFAAQTLVNGIQKTVALRWNTQQAPNTYVVPQLPRGSHYIKWILEDACGNVVNCQYDFSILADSTLPLVNCPPNITVSADSLSCDAVFTYTVTASDDQPGWTLAQTTGLASGATFPLGETINQFQATSVGGSTAMCSFTVTVADYTPPVAKCSQSLIVALGGDDPNDCYQQNLPDEYAGVTWVNVTTFNDSSFDNCSNIKLTIRRMAPYSDCIQNLNPVNGQSPCGDLFPDFPSEYERAIDESDSIKFYCCEKGTSQSLLLRAYQLDGTGDVAFGPNGPIFNDCVIVVNVKDKIKPVCSAPANVTVSCENFDPSLSVYGEATGFDNCCLNAV